MTKQSDMVAQKAVWLWSIERYSQNKGNLIVCCCGHATPTVLSFLGGALF